MKRTLLATLLCLAWAILWVAPANAHAAYKTSDPADESRVGAAPSSVWAEYTEPPGPGSTMEITDPCGQQVDDGNVSYDRYRMSVGMSSDRAGVFTVSWYAISTLDGHPSRGSFTFTATSGTACPGAEKEGSSDPEDEESSTEPTSKSEESGGSVASGAEADNTDVGAEQADEGRAKERSHHRKDKGGAEREDKRRREAVVETRVLGDRTERPRDLTPTLLITFGLAALIGTIAGRLYAGWTENG